MHVFVGNFTYVIDFMIVEDISSILDPRLSQVVLGRPFIETSNMTHDPPKGVVRFIKRSDEVAYKMPHKIEQYDSLSDLEKEHTKSVYLRNEEDKRRGVVRILQKSQENGQSRTNTDTGKEREYKSRENAIKAHKLLFKEVVGKLVKKVKLLEDKLKGRKRKFVMTDSDKEEDAEQDVDPLIKLAKAAATAAAASAVPTGGSHEADIPPSSSIPSDEFAGGSAIPAGATTGPSVDPSNKGKSPLLEEDPPVRERTFRQKEEDRLGEEAARRMYEEEKAELEREREEMQRKRQQDVLNSAKYYTDSDWTDIIGQVHANQGLTADLLGPDVNEDNFAERMIALIAKRRRDFAAQKFQDKRNKPMTYAQQKAYMITFVKNQSSTIYTTGCTMKHVKLFFDDQLKTEFDKIRAVVAELKSQNIRRSLKRPGADLEQASSKKSKSTEAPKSSVPDESQQPYIEDVEAPSNTASTAQHTASSPKKVGTQKKQLGQKGVHTSHSTIPIKDGDPEAEHKMCIKYASDEDSASDDDTPVNLYAVVDLELLPTGLGSINGDLQVLMDSPEVNDVSGLVVHMFVDKKYPLSVNLIERMLDHQLEICHETVGNELTTAWLVQEGTALGKDYIKSVNGCDDLPKIIKDLNSPISRLDAGFLVADSKFMKVAFGVGFKMIVVSSSSIVTTSRDVVPTGRVKVLAGRYVVPTGKDNVIVNIGRTKVIPAGSTILVLVLSLDFQGLDGIGETSEDERVPLGTQEFWCKL
ncbi:hypothetical protein Tco_0667691 [Tanacetum coccineum]